MRPSYYDMASALGLVLCHGINPRNGQYCQYDHKNGEYAEGMIHWRRERLVNSAIRRFLIVASMSEPSVAAAEAHWRQIYRSHVWMAVAQQQLHLRLPAALSDGDKAYVRAMLATLAAGRFLMDDEATAALKWSRP